jgi:hypothetical protein
MNEREFWIAFRAALLAIIAAVERWQKIGKASCPNDERSKSCQDVVDNPNS